ncbi:hypothetical protein OJF2_00460 [Aquisphaera giovannonii]|uniref:PEP-CTERM protein-sorting domain-containing protein n=1 Tax=Aquisphaera giovannonii TaxID=406548 RepID=A0A5B9VUY0_9BACT|nr:hypothetical protein [Aquisphaera giovannonii]QEH31581.1 hypothetical protein OJF2_00460 [Aquisphaera giovannonii]
MNATHRIVGMLVTLSALLDAAAARADAVKPWAGASASTTVFKQASSQSGATATASGAGDTDVSYIGYDRATYYNITVHGSASASATGRADGLLEVGGHYNAGNPGSMTGSAGPIGPLSATAGWDGDRVIVTPPAGGAMPGSVRLNFSLAFQGPPGYQDAVWQYGSLQVDANGRSIAIRPTGWIYGPPENRVTGEFDSLTASKSAADQYVGTFHIDLALNPSGVSDPFHLSLSSLPNVGLMRNGGYYSDQWASLALTGVTLPDGSPLAAAGYGVSFASGLLVDPSPVPEPASLACWALVALGASRVIRSGRREPGPRAE